MAKIPDITTDSAAPVPGALDQVGMRGVEIPVYFKVNGGKPILLPALGDLLINIVSPKVRGIHMSRLYMAALEHFKTENLTLSSLNKLLPKLLKTHPKVSTKATAAFQFTYPKQVKSLKTKHLGWRYYPVTFSGTLDGKKITLEQTIRITYASTCPCSGALTRQLMQQHFKEAFKGKTVSRAEVTEWLGNEAQHIATPHSQRSHADITVSYREPAKALSIDKLIELCEKAVATPVQAVVKRTDEQEFARLSGTNLMFSEDAARLLKAALKKQKSISNYRISVRHMEGLHAHDAVVVTGK